MTHLPADYNCMEHPEGPHLWKPTGYPKTCMICGLIYRPPDIDMLDMIRAAIPNARQVAARAGSMHSLWDVIGDAEDALAGRETRMSLGDILEALENAK